MQRGASFDPSLLTTEDQGVDTEKLILFKEPFKQYHSFASFESLSNTDDAFRIFFKRHTCYDLLPMSSKLVVLDTTLNVKKAFFSLVYNNVRAALLWDSSRGQFTGMLTITDFIRILQNFYKSRDTPMTELESHQISTWRDLISGCIQPLVQSNPECTLLEATTNLLTSRVHRLPVIDPTTGNPFHILTHKRLLKYLHIHMEELPHPAYLLATLSELGIGTFEAICTVPTDCPLIQAFGLFLDRKVSALPVVDEDNKLVDIYSKFDVINLAANRTYHNLDVTVYDALEYRRGRFDGVATCSLSDSLQVIIDRIVNASVHRLVCVDIERHVLGIVSLSDILRFLIEERAKPPVGTI